MRWSTGLGRVGIIVLLTLLSIVIHELGHFAVYKFAGVPVRVTLQSVRPTGPVKQNIHRAALAAGPAFSILAAFLCLVVVPSGSAFVWVAAAFTNATLRLFPCAMDIARAAQNAHAFSDEGELAASWAMTSSGRIVLVLLPFVLYVALTIAAGRRFSFARHRVLKIVAIYVLSLAVGIGVVLIDELIH